AVLPGFPDEIASAQQNAHDLAKIWAKRVPVAPSSDGNRKASMSANRTCGEAAIDLLEAYGVDTVFGIPGVHTLDLYRGLANTTIRHIAVRHEQGAGFMADGYARASGR